MRPRKRPERADILPFEQPEANDRPFDSPLHPTFEECDDESLLELDAEYWDALLPDDDYEALPERGDFWTDQDAA
ncbi:MAG: hypothetical protein JNL18_00110 [Planctomycetaceae bacterium]|jgi:hypothetical protein|uniref:Uncharacterized protein n=1 Tax=Lacipirellula limnantheis TaxID=2528024 RepID=A0A517U470_9BACT|nr:hypothetical protein [Lacipirellula limnantheis]MBL9161122.1 hypothetical protein [Planctomycetaceae bacterium]QDT75426.1 hypothetical protein I41_46360 [Lacipirellula limnantheis]